MSTQSRIGCALNHYPDPPGPTRWLKIGLGNGRNLGPALNLLRSRVEGDSALAETVIRHTPEEEVYRSAIELVLMMSAACAGPLITFDTNIKDEESVEAWERVCKTSQQHKLIVFLLHSALKFGQNNTEHVEECPKCRKQGDSSPFRVREQILRDLADSIAVQSGDDIETAVIAYVDAQHLIDIALFLVEIAEEWYSISPAEQINQLAQVPLHLLAEQDTGE